MTLVVLIDSKPKIEVILWQWDTPLVLLFTVSMYHVEILWKLRNEIYKWWTWEAFQNYACRFHVPY